MARSSSLQPAFSKNYYAILALPPPSARSPANTLSGEQIKKAYRKALLGAHPDKSHAAKGNAEAQHDGVRDGRADESQTHGGEPGKGKKREAYTVDDVLEAYTTLSDPQTRAAYEIWFLAHQNQLHGFSSHASITATTAVHEVGMEVLDLDDFVEGDGEWTRACRCGEEKGFRVAEEELDGAVKRGEGEVLVGCGGCSLWVRVGFGVVEG